MRQVAQAVPHQPCHCVGNGGNGHRTSVTDIPIREDLGGLQIIKQDESLEKAIGKLRKMQGE